MTSSEQTKIEEHAPAYLRNVIRIITETGLRVYKELAPMKKEQVDLAKRTVFITDSKTPTGVAEVPLTDIAVEAFCSQTGRTSLHADREKLGCLTVLGGSGASSIPVLRGVVRSAWFATRSTPQRSDRQSEQISLKHAGWVLFPL
jgi:integrase